MKITKAQRIVLSFLKVETWSDVKTLKMLLDHNSVQATHQLAKRMCSNGLLVSAKLQLLSGHSITLYGITETGQAYAWELSEDVTTSVVFQPSKVSPLMLQHELDMQKLHIQAEHNGWTQWQNGKHLGRRIEGAKYPDAVAVSPQGIICCMEVEREIKSTSRMRQILASHLAQRKSGQWQKIVYLCPSMDLALRLKRKCSTLEYVTWRGSRILLTPNHLEHFIFSNYAFFNSTESEKPYEC
jgi:hypothetical protein